MEFLSIDITLFLEQYGYAAVFLLMLVAGPVGATAGGFLAGAGTFNPWLIWVLSSTADITTDIFYYSVGRWGGVRIIDKLRPIFRWSDKLFKRLDWLYRHHGKKTLFIIKFSQGIGTLAQVLAGISRMPLRQFIPVNLGGGIIYNGMLVWLGVLGGTFWADKIKDLGILITGLIVVTGLVLLIASQMQKRVFKNIPESK